MTSALPTIKVPLYISTNAKNSDLVHNTDVDDISKLEVRSENSLNRDQEKDDDIISARTKIDCSLSGNGQTFLDSTNIESDESEISGSYKDLDDIDDLLENPISDNANDYASLKSSNDGGSEDRLVDAVSAEQNLDISKHFNESGGYHTMDSRELPIAANFNSNNEITTQRSDRSPQVEDFSILDHNIELYMDLKVYVNDERSKCNLKVGKKLYNNYL